MKDAAAERKDTGLEAKSRALEEKDATISAMSEQLTKARDYLAANKQQVSALCAPLLVVQCVDACDVRVNYLS